MKTKIKLPSLLSNSYCRSCTRAMLVTVTLFSLSIQAAEPHIVALSGYDPVGYFKNHKALKGSQQFQKIYKED